MNRHPSSVPIGVAALLTLLAACAGPQYPSCNNDEQCHRGEFCVNGTCQQCRPGGDDCAPGQHCVEGRCEPIDGYCASAGDCPSGQECRNNRCVAAVTSRVTELPPPSCTLSSVYFAYDSSELDASARSTLQANAECIQQRNLVGVRLTGHTDPRGTEEYNLALGDRRAQQVKSYLGNLGIDAARVTTASMGEEMASGEDEAGWARDRRVDFAER
jgi:peptidoglycan-associated lipoprotein